MLKFNNIIWLLRKNFFITFILLVLVLFFSLYVNFTSINDKLTDNNKLISHSIQNSIRQHKIRLDLYSKALEVNPELKKLDLKSFSAFYYLDKDGDVVEKHCQDRKDPIKKFAEINLKKLADVDSYISELIIAKDHSASLYFAKKLENSEHSFLVAKLELFDLLQFVNKFNTDYILVDSFGNVLYSSNPSKLALLENVNEFNYYWYLSGIYQTDKNSSNIVKEIEYKGFNVRSFIAISEYFNYYFIISAFLLIILIMYFWNSYLDFKLIRLGLVKQVKYCYDLQGASEIDEFRNYDLIEGSDLIELQKQTAFSVLEYKDIKKEYRELEQRLSSMFSKSTIPMLMIDAFTGKIFKANQSALDFYNQKITSMSKLNLYMLGKKEQKDVVTDPIHFANNMQNSIKNQGFYIQTEHYVNGEDFKEVKIYPFVMRSERFCYDILMILDTNMVSKSYEIIKSQYEALEKSFIITMSLALKGGRLKIKSCSKNIDRILGISSNSLSYFKDLIYENSQQAYLELLLKLKQIRQNNLSSYSKIIEQNIYLRQSNGRYAEFKVSFNITKDLNYDNAKTLNIIAHLVLIRGDLLEDETKELISFNEIYKYTNSKIGIFDKDFRCLNANKELKTLLGIRNVNNFYLGDIITQNPEKVLRDIQEGKSAVFSNTIYIKDALNIIHACKLSCAIVKNSLGENVFCIVFREDNEALKLDGFIEFCRSKGVTNLDDLYCDYYYKIIGNIINHKESFDNLNCEYFHLLDESKEKYLYMKELIALIKSKDRDLIMQKYENGKNIFRGDIYE